MKKNCIVIFTIVVLLLLATAAYAAPNNKEWKSSVVDSDVVSPAFGYMVGWDKIWHSVLNPGPDQVYKSLADLLIAETALTRADLAGLSESAIRDIAHDLRFSYYVTELEALTEQIWAVQVEAEPEQSGTLNQNFEAAYGPWADSNYFGNYNGDSEKPDVGWWFIDEGGRQIGFDNLFSIAIAGIDIGKDYVGNYFNIDQLAGTSDGTIKRFISISSPWSHAFIEEDMIVTGIANISETFIMDNLKPGAEAISDWWSLF